MSNPGATNSQAVAVNNNNNNVKVAAAQTANGMSFSSTSASVTAPDSPQSQQTTPAITNKMGSRRIFSPHFKIQVLESYRNDSDCKGNQRATARKYGIHRRQIQKWLQCETALRTSVSSSGSSSSSNSPPMGLLTPTGNGKQVDSNNNNNQQQKWSLNGSKPSEATASMLSTSSIQARHSVDSATVRLAEETAAECASVGERNATHTQKNSMEFFSPTTTSLIINGGAAGGPGDGDRQIGSMNEAAVPIKPEFCFTSSPSASASSPHPSSSIGRSAVDMPSTAAAMFKHQHHLHHKQQLSGGVEEDAPHHSLISAAVPALPPFISTIYGPQSLLAFPCSFPFEYAAPSVHQHLLSPIDLSVGNAQRRHAGDLFRRSPLIQVDDAQVPSRGVTVEDREASSAMSVESSASVAPIDLSCTRKRKSTTNAVEPVKPPKLFKPYLLDEQDEEEEELKVVDDEDDRSAVSHAKEDPFLEQDLAVLKDRLSHPAAVYPASHHNQYYPGSSPAYESLYYSHENLTLYPSPRQYRYESSASAESSPIHHPSRPASIYDSSSSSESAFGNYHPSSPASSVRSSPTVFSAPNWPPLEMRSRILGSAF